MWIIRKISAFIISVLLLTACLSTPPAKSSPAPQAPTAGLSQARLSVYPEDGANGLLTRIASARQRVLLTMYLLTDQRFIDALKSARMNGATVRVLIEQHPVGDSSSGQDVYGKLRTSGIETRYAYPYFRLTHEKSLVIDNSAVILTANMTISGFRFNREFAITTDEPDVVKEIVDVFNADWSRTSIIPNNPYLVWSPINSRVRIGAVISTTRRTLDVYAEEVQDDEQTQALVNAAGAGSVVRLLISPPRDSASEDANAADLDRLQRGGIRVRYLSKPYIHAKVFVVDDALAFIGSQNISTNSLEFNRELGVIVSDATAARRIAETFAKDWNSGVER
jgi:cardiolipin synthase